jgi:hypothetical protein
VPVAASRRRVGNKTKAMLTAVVLHINRLKTIATCMGKLAIVEFLSIRDSCEAYAECGQRMRRNQLTIQ